MLSRSVLSGKLTERYIKCCTLQFKYYKTANVCLVILNSYNTDLKDMTHSGFIFMKRQTEEKLVFDTQRTRIQKLTTIRPGKRLLPLNQ